MEPSAHILVVDDHREIRDLLSRYLAKNGFRVSTADGASRARKVLEASAIDLVVLDIMMPGEDGLSLCRHLRATRDVPVIMLTAVGRRPTAGSGSRWAPTTTW
jgi:two-component system OmpR family response regulator